MTTTEAEATYQELLAIPYDQRTPAQQAQLVDLADRLDWKAYKESKTTEHPHLDAARRIPFPWETQQATVVDATGVCDDCQDKLDKRRRRS